MSRCDFDAVFYRVFCITLLAVAFTFTLILTNVFIDIDGLLSKKHAKHKVITERESGTEEGAQEMANIDDTNYGETEDAYRTKRSIETQNILFHIKNPKLKDILTNRLQSLLDSLDAEETFPIKDREIKSKDEAKEAARETVVKKEENNRRQKDEDILHLTVHNILLQGIIGHMDLKEVFKRVSSLMLELNNRKEDKEESDKNKLQEKKSKDNLSQDITKHFIADIVRRNEVNNEKALNTVNNDDNKISFNSLIKSGSVNQIKVIPLKTSQGEIEQQETVSGVQANTSTGPNVLIKTTIEIKTSDNRINETITKDNIQGIIELIYNGKPIKFSLPDSIITSSIKPSHIVIPTKSPKSHKESAEYSIQTSNTDIHNFNRKPKEYLNKFLTEYFKHFPNERINNEQFNENVNTGRHKRHVKIKFKQTDKIYRNPFQEKINDIDSKKKEDDELYVEIETHFDSKGMKGEKKKKLIKSLVDKIQKAIRSDEPKQNDKQMKQSELNNNNKKKHKKVHVKKRLQNPLKYKEAEKLYTSVNNVIHRQLDPIIISKTMDSQSRLPNVRVKSGETWKKEYIGPTFLTATKSINSAELSELDVDFSRVLDINGIPQRLQKPLNTDMSEETLNANSFYDLGKMKFFIKNIDGSGFSVGYNQYVDEPPDDESMKLFTGLENVIKAYHDNYDIQAQEENTDLLLNQPDDEQETPSKNIHMILRRSIDEKSDYHSNEYKIIYDSKFLPYENYKEIYEGKNSKTDIELNNSKNVFKKPPLVVDEHILEKKLKPAEIFSLANLLSRKKRSINVKKISNIKTKFKLNRYLNTKRMANKKIFLNKRRSKREINKIRIIATDFPQKDSSDENIFIVSDENLLADRATIKEVSTPEAPEVSEVPEVDPDKFKEPDQTEDMEYPTYKLFAGKYRRNSLMSKYPHIFMEEITRSKEENDPDNTVVFHKLPAINNVQLIDTDQNVNQAIIDVGTTPEPILNLKYTDVTEKSQEIQDIVQALQGPKTNYKVTVKIIPKNISADFKEIHTSINKRFNKNGFIYSSLVNMSEISKVTKTNKKNNTENKDTIGEYLASKIKTHQNKMHLLLKERQKRIDEQLSRLNAEKSNIESIFIEDNNNSVPHVDYVNTGIPSKLLKILHINTEDANKFFTTKTPLTTVTTITPITTTQQTEPSTYKETTITTITTTQTTAQTTPQPPLIDNLKKDILRKIERNEHLTNEVLQKINKNTEILKIFLKKLSDQIDPQKTEHKTHKDNIGKSDRVHHKNIRIPQGEIHKEYIHKPEMESRKTDMHFTDREPLKEETKIEKPVAKFDVNVYPLDWRDHHIPFQPMSFRKNESHMAIPFVYTYQQPSMPKINPPLTSVVYHGHIHTLHSDKTIPLEKEKLHLPTALQTQTGHEREQGNDTKFFIDEQLNDFKIMPTRKIERPLSQNLKNGTVT